MALCCNTNLWLRLDLTNSSASGNTPQSHWSIYGTILSDSALHFFHRHHVLSSNTPPFSVTMLYISFISITFYLVILTWYHDSVTRDTIPHHCIDCPVILMEDPGLWPSYIAIWHDKPRANGNFISSQQQCMCDNKSCIYTVKPLIEDTPDAKT